MTTQEHLPLPPQSDSGDEIHAVLGHAPETQQPPEGFSYQQFDTGRRFPEGVMTFQRDGRTTYLLPITDDPEADTRKLDAVAETGASLRLLPSGGDRYSDSGQSFFQDLVAQGYPLGSPDGPERVSEALLFDPHSVKSLLDVMIATGHDTPELQEECRAALRGEETSIGTTLKALELLSRKNDPTADVLSNVLDVGDGLYSEKLIESLVTKGFDSYLFEEVGSKVESGVSLELIERAVTEPEHLQALVTEAWNEIIAIAKQKNGDVQGEGIYTELHRVGKVIIPVPAIASSTAKQPRGEYIEYVDQYSGHTLVGIYGSSLFGSGVGLNQETVDTFNNSRLARLLVETGLGISGQNTLERRCSTTIDSSGNPVIHLPQADPYRPTYNSINDEAIIRIFGEQGIQIDRTVGGSKKEVLVNPSDKPVDVKIKELIAKSEGTEKEPIAVLTGLKISDSGITLDWASGYNYGHDDLFAASFGVFEKDKYIDVMIGGTPFKLKAEYCKTVIGPHDSKEVIQKLIWLFKGNKSVFEKHLPEVLSVIQTSGEVLGVELGEQWGATLDMVRSGVVLIDPNTEQGSSSTTYFLRQPTKTN